MKKLLLASAVALTVSGGAQASEHSGTYAFETKASHQFITYKISHLG